MTSRTNDFDFAHFVKLTKRRFRKKFKKSISSTDIRKICTDFIQCGIIEKVIEGGVVKIDKNSTIEIVGTPLLDDRRMFNLLLQGKSVSRAGKLKSADMNSRRKDVKYKITYTHSLNKVNFKADPYFSKQVHNAIVNTNNYYRICP